MKPKDLFPYIIYIFYLYNKVSIAAKGSICYFIVPLYTLAANGLLSLPRSKKYLKQQSSIHLGHYS